MTSGDSNNQQTYFNISSKAILKVFLVVLGVWLLYLMRDVLAVVFVSLVFAALIDPIAAWFGRRHVPRSVAVLIIYTIFFGILALSIILIIPPIVEESKALGDKFGILIERFDDGVFDRLKLFAPEKGILHNLENVIATFGGKFSSAWSGILSTLTGFFGGLTSFFLIAVLSFYLVVEDNAMRQMIKVVLPSKYHAEAASLISKIQKKVGSWIKGQLVLALIIGVLTYIGLVAANMPYALVLALIAAVTEFIPYIGPVFGAIPAVFLALTISPTMGLIVIVIYIVIQQLERIFLVPKIMQKALGLNPVISIVALVAGFKLGGILGVLLALPVTAALDVVLREYLEKRIK